ncbi:MAG TPA: amidohydrolase family protein, partial [Nitrososphaeraceae archaeon]|nr:amidohydrolase family protein [Nitrososphaeraceae archaeon]
MALTISNISLFIGENLEYIDRGYLVVKNGIIESVGTGDYKGRSDGAIYDGEGILAIPGFIKAHTHIGDSFGKDIGVDSAFETRIHPIYGIKNKILQKSERKHLVNFMRSSAMSMMRNGIVAFADFREGGLEGIDQIKEAISGLSIKGIVLGRPEFYHDISKDFVKNPKLPPDVIELVYLIANAADGLGISGANESTDNSLNEYGKVLKNSLKKKFLIGIHAAESLETIKKSITITGKSEVQRIVSKLLPNFVVHLTHASDMDIELVARKKIGIVVCPRANGALGVGIPRISKMLSSGCCVGIGTDNIMINSPDMFRELDYVWKVSRTLADRPIPAREILKMATVNGGKILDINSGAIMTGMSADIIFIDKNNLDISPMHDPHVSVIHRANASCILNVMINGKFIDGDEFG